MVALPIAYKLPLINVILTYRGLSFARHAHFVDKDQNKSTVRILKDAVDVHTIFTRGVIMVSEIQ